MATRFDVKGITFRKFVQNS